MATTTSRRSSRAPSVDGSNNNSANNDSPYRASRTESEEASDMINEIRRVQTLLFSETVREPAQQAEIMAYYVIGTLQEVAISSEGMVGTVGALQSFNTEHFQSAVTRAMFLTRMPVVRNFDNTLSLVRPPFITVVQDSFLSLTEIYTFFHDKLQDDLRPYFRPWSQVPDVIVDWWRRKSAHLDAAQMWALPDGEVGDHVRRMEAPVEIALDG